MKITFHGDDLPSSREFDIKRGREEGRWHVPEEVPVAFVYNRRNYSVMMATPDDLADFAIGFSLTEKIISEPWDIISLDIFQTVEGADLRFKITKEALEKIDIIHRRRNMVGSASCGLCGLENADVLFQKLDPVSKKPVDLDLNVLASALEVLNKHQPLNRLTRTVHAAAWADQNGEIKTVREDVGRHNALDKLLGAMAMDKTDVAAGFVVMSSRCSYEIVEKAARQGVKALVSLSAPTAFALRKATEANMAIYSQSATGPVRLL
ncbi:MAG: formate dehydrogenase accessory sulfurtransferase FdhD [Hellea sp.]|nr:formate dehydrogenase accessory sulfurtransferase FdhD [Hellea sp.]